jgi:hypothetical protein
MTPRQDSDNNNKESDDKPDIVNNNPTNTEDIKDSEHIKNTAKLVDADNNPTVDTKLSLTESLGNKKVRDVPAPSSSLVTSVLSPTGARNKVVTSPTTKEDDDDMAELWAKLRCGSLRTEEVAERERKKEERLKNRQNRCADYPGLAFGSAMYGSDTMMKFNIIKNELQNIMRSQLKRVDGEVNALSSRVKQLDKNLEQSEMYIRTATAALADAVSLQIEESKSLSDQQESQQDNLSSFDQHVLFLEAQLKEAKLKASQSFQILEDCYQAQESLYPSTPTLPNPPTSTPSPPIVPPTRSSSQLQPDLLLNNVTQPVVDNLNRVNEANNNITTTTFIGSSDNTCLKTRITEEDSANANLPV